MAEAGKFQPCFQWMCFDGVYSGPAIRLGRSFLVINLAGSAMC